MSERGVGAVLFGLWVAFMVEAIWALRPRGHRQALPDWTATVLAGTEPAATGTAPATGPIPVAEIVAAHLGRTTVPDPQDTDGQQPLYVPQEWSAGVQPLTAIGPSAPRSRIPAPNLPSHREASCGRCRDHGFLGGCTSCGRHPVHRSP